MVKIPGFQINSFGCVIGRGYTNQYYPLSAAFPKLLPESLLKRGKDTILENDNDA